jgi:thiamine pyrophosphokinase
MNNYKIIAVRIKAILFLNGEPPEKADIPDLEGYSQSLCADGAYAYLHEYGIIPDLILGDMDSLPVPLRSKEVGRRIVELPDQDYTDFEKILMYLHEKTDIRKIDVYGASGREQDHFLGNLHVANKYQDKFDLTFYDQYQTYFMVSSSTILKDVQGKTISLIPLFLATNVTTQGLRWELEDHAQISLRNQAVLDTVDINVKHGCLGVFVNRNR